MNYHSNIQTNLHNAIEADIVSLKDNRQMNREVVKALVEKLTNIENEMSLLREDRKIIVDDYKDKLDMKAFMAAWQIIKKREKVDEAILDNLLNILQEM